MVIKRAGLYERVSTDEQAKFGYSIQAQIDNLTEYCEKNQLKVVDHYCDEGISGGKAAFKRPEMSRLLEDVKAGKIDVILFTRLDRWFRNVKEYFKVQEILEEHKVTWKAIHEDYDTSTASGEMAVTIFLAIAQNERQKTAERLTAVFDNKRKRKEAWYGKNSIPFGYMKETDEEGIPRLVKNPELQEAVQEFWDMAIKYHNVSKAGKYVNEVYGLKRTKKLWFDIIRNEIYTGELRGVEGYCEPYVSKEEWLTFQSRGNIKKTQKGRVYLFTGLIRCPECGKVLTSVSSGKRTKKNGEVVEYNSYRCRYGEMKLCDFRSNVFELKTEKWLLDNLGELLQNEIAEVELERAKPKKKPKTNIQSLKEQARRLTVAYMAGNIPDDEYLKEDAELKAKIAKAESEKVDDPAERDLTGLKELLETDFKTIYNTLSKEDKRRFWRNIIKEIQVEGSAVKSVVFL